MAHTPNPPATAEQLIQALELVTSDDWAERHQDYRSWQAHSRVMDQYFAHANDGSASDWTWSAVLPYWQPEDLAVALDQWRQTEGGRA